MSMWIWGVAIWMAVGAQLTRTMTNVLYGRGPHPEFDGKNVAASWGSAFAISAISPAIVLSFVTALLLLTVAYIVAAILSGVGRLLK